MNRCRTSLALLVVLLLTSSLPAQSIWKESKNPDWKSATGAEQYTRLLWQAVRKKDWLAVDSHIASNFVYMDAAGTKDKQQYLEYLRNLTLTEPTIGEVNVTASGVASIVTYTLTLKTATGGDAVRVMAVWQQEKSGWVLIAVSRTNI